MKVTVGVAAVACGALFSAFGELPASVTDGIILHLDAHVKSKNSLVLNASGQVLEWHSLVGQVVFTNTPQMYCTNDKKEHPTPPPYYDTGYADGRGGVAFGYLPGGTTSSPTFLYAMGLGTGFKPKSFFMVITHHSVWQNWPPVFVSGGNNNGFGLYSQSGDEVQWYRSLQYFTWMRLNGNLAFDANRSFGYFYPQGPNYEPVASMKKGQLYVMSSAIINDKNFNNTYMGMSRFDSLNLASPYYFKGWIGEIIAYDRELTDTERAMVEASLMEKWRGDTMVYWKGGDTGNWSEAANWEGGVPTADSRVYVTNAAAITVDAAVQVSGLSVCDGGSLTFAKDSSFAASKCLVIPASGYSLTAQGTVLQFPFDSNLGLCESFSFSGTNILQVAKGSSLEFPQATAISGLLKLPGAGTVAFSADGQLQDADLDVQTGYLDLNGTQQTFHRLYGGGVVINSANEKSHMTFVQKSADEKVGLVNAVSGANIDIVQKGPGRLEAQGLFDRDIRLEGGTLAAVPELTVGAMKGCIVHLDASRVDSMTLNAAGQVSSWRSLTPNGLSFNQLTFDYINTQWSISNDYTNARHLPYYRTNQLNGRPGVAFAPTDVADPTSSLLISNQQIPSNVTFFVVSKMPAQQNKVNAQLYGFLGWDAPHDALLFIPGATTTAWSVYYASTRGGSALVNGETIYDATAEDAAEKVTTIPYEADVPHLLCVRRIAAYTGSDPVDKIFASSVPKPAEFPVIGHGTQHVYYQGQYWRGVLGEFIIFNRRLTDEEVHRVQESLMMKWGIDPGRVYELEDTLGTNSTVTVAGTAAYDMSQVPQHPKTLEFVKDAQGVAPTLTVRGNFDLTRTELELTGAAETAPARLIDDPDAGLSGKFTNADELDFGLLKLKCGKSSVRISLPGLLLFLK